MSVKLDRPRFGNLLTEVTRMIEAARAQAARLERNLLEIRVEEFRRQLVMGRLRHKLGTALRVRAGAGSAPIVVGAAPREIPPGGGRPTIH